MRIILWFSQRSDSIYSRMSIYIYPERFKVTKSAAKGLPSSARRAADGAERWAPLMAG